jgi:beta-1,4-mannosyl-glycoprotein beta-1,4-N-acetylglucosaminyltransferase
MKTYSLTPFFNELDVLEIRLAELDPVVDVHVIAEAPVTYSGDPKPLYLAENWSRFRQWEDKIRYIVVEDMPAGESVYREPHAIGCEGDSDRWRREHHQRDALSAGLWDLKDDDLLLLSDLDEIPFPHVVADCATWVPNLEPRIVRPRMTQFVYRLRWRWHDTMIPIASFFPPAILRYYDNSLQRVREAEAWKIGEQAAPGLGWHLSYMGGPDAVAYKLRSAAHHELDTDAYNNPSTIGDSLATGRDLFGRQDRNALRAGDDELPPYALANRDRFAHLL